MMVVMPRYRPVRLSDYADGRNNNFDVLRLFAAGLVLASHSFPLTDTAEPLARMGGPTMGGLGVALFFAMSGLLITKSWTRDPRIGPFAQKRARRILPGLWVATAWTTLLLGPIVSDRSLWDYITNFQPWTYLFRCMALITFDGRLPGVFVDNPYAGAVNGSLWTLPLEALAYALVALLGMTGLLAQKGVVAVFFALSVVGSVMLQTSVAAEPVSLLAYFLSGVALYRFRSRIVLSWWGCGLALALWIGAFGTSALPAAGAVCLPYITMVIAYRTPAYFRRMTSLGDVSYGMYVYAFPVQQTIVFLSPNIGAVHNVLYAAPVAWLAGLLSWKLVEEPALSARRRRETKMRSEVSNA